MHGQKDNCCDACNACLHSDNFNTSKYRHKFCDAFNIDLQIFFSTSINLRISETSLINTWFLQPKWALLIHKQNCQIIFAKQIHTEAHRDKKDRKTYELLTPPFFTPDCRNGQALTVKPVKFGAVALGKRHAVCYVCVLRYVLCQNCFAGIR